MSESIHISAIISTYNRDKTIARAIDSVILQEYVASEIIVIDDGSKDHTREIVARYGGKVRYVYQDNLGVASARNLGVNEAKYEWIAFLDSDDYWLPHHLKRITDVIRDTERKAALYFADIKRPVEEEGGSHWDLCGFSIPSSYEFRQDASEWAMMRTQPMMLQASVIRRENYIEIGGIPETLLTREDTFLFYKLCLISPACAVSGCGAAMSSDCNESGRLTVTYDGRTHTFHECTKLLYKELLRGSGKMSDDHRRAIKKMLVWAHLEFSRVLLKKKQFPKVLENTFGAVGISPICSAEIAMRMLIIYFAKRLRYILNL